MKSRAWELLAAGGVLAAWILAALAAPSLPAQIPMHFDWQGAPNQLAPAWTLWGLPAFATVVYFALRVAQRVPSRWRSYPVRITDRNREAVYALGRQMLPVMNAFSVLIFVAVEWNVIDAALHGAAGVSYAVTMYTPIVLLFGTLIYYTIRMRAA